MTTRSLNIALRVAVTVFLLTWPLAATAGVTQAGAPLAVAGPWTGVSGGCGAPIGNVIACVNGPLKTVAPNAAQVAVATEVMESPLTISSATSFHSFNLPFQLTAPTTVVLRGTFAWQRELEDVPGSASVQGSTVIRPLPDPAPGAPPLVSLAFGPPVRRTQGTDPLTTTVKSTKITLPAGGYEVRAFVSAAASIDPSLVPLDRAFAGAGLSVSIHDLVGRLVVAPQQGVVGQPASISLVNAGAFPAPMEITRLTVTRPNGVVDAYNPGLLPGAAGGPPRIAGGLSFTAVHPGAGFPARANVGQPGVYRVSLTFDDVVEGEFEREPDCNQNGIADSIDLEDGESEDVDSSGVPDECEVVRISCSIDGTAEGGTASVTVDGFSATCAPPAVVTTAGETAEMVAAALAAALATDPCLGAQDISANAESNHLVVTGFALSPADVTISLLDPGLVVVTNVLKIPTLSTWGLLLLVLALLGLGVRRLRHL